MSDFDFDAVILSGMALGAMIVGGAIGVYNAVRYRPPRELDERERRRLEMLAEDDWDPRVPN